MKKFICIIMTVATLLFCVTAALTACSDDTVTGETPTATATDSGSNSVFPKALSGVEAIKVPDIAYTQWEFCGGMINGKEMEQADADAVLKEYGGELTFIFPDEGGTVTLNAATDSDSGKYTVEADGFGVKITMTKKEFYGVFTTVDGEKILVISNKADSEKALYFRELISG